MTDENPQDSVSPPVGESNPLSNQMDLAPPPSLLAYGVANLVIGLAVLVLAKLIFKRDARVGLMAAAIAVVLHHRFDAPLARKLLRFTKSNRSQAATGSQTLSG